MFLLHSTRSPSHLNNRAFLICVLRDTAWYAEGTRDVGLVGAPVVMFLLHTTRSPNPLNNRAFLICVSVSGYFKVRLPVAK